MTDTMSHTLTVGDSASPAPRDAEDEGCLYVVLECSRMTAPPSRHFLGGVSEVQLGRGSRREHERSEERLSLRIPDRWMSSVHARLTHSFGRWLLEDQESKNGTAVNGVESSRHILEDGDIIEIGHSLLLFRRVSRAPELAGDAVLDAEVQPRGLSTLEPSLEASFADLKRVAGSDIRVLLLGESGTGKEVLANAIHRLSGRRGEFIAVNCGALPANLVESELFGHKKGAFSGAESDRPGLVRSADGGTLFLDEIGDLPGAAQAALLRVLQEGEVLPVGGTKPVPVDIRLVCATHRDLDRMVERGAFRHDLYARISGFRMHLPPLRDRREDIGMLATHFLRQRILERGTAEDVERYAGIDAAAALRLLTYDWPLNIRELESALGTAFVLAGKGPIEDGHLPDSLRSRALRPHSVATGATLSERSTPPLSAADQKLRAELLECMRKHDGNISAVAREMGKDRKQIQRWVKRLAIDAAQFRRD